MTVGPKLRHIGVPIERDTISSPLYTVFRDTIVAFHEVFLSHDLFQQRPLLVQSLVGQIQRKNSLPKDPYEEVWLY